MTKIELTENEVKDIISNHIAKKYKNKVATIEINNYESPLRIIAYFEEKPKVKI